MSIARLIDHTLLRPDATMGQIFSLFLEGEKYNFASVCINPCWVSRGFAHLRGTGVKVCTVVGFPFGANLAEIKQKEAERALTDGAREIDMVMDIGALKYGMTHVVIQDIRAVRYAAQGAILKVIIEACLLTRDEKILACKIARDEGADFVKTSTGFSSGGATVHDVRLMRETVGTTMGVKASGGIKSYADAKRMLAAGATRIGTSAGVKIVEEELRSDLKNRPA